MRIPLDVAIRRYARESQAEELDLLRTLARLPAPSGHEEQRANFVAGWLHAHGAKNVRVDGAKNVICLLVAPTGGRGAKSENPRAMLPAGGGRPLTIFAAHTDVVFDDTTELPFKEDEKRMYAPGVGDDTANLAGLLMATRFLLQNPRALARATRDTNLLIVANSCEEGLGNLHGTRTLFEQLGQEVARYYSFDLYLPQCIPDCVGSERYRIDVTCTGGHSYHDFGRPNAIEELCSLVGDLYRINPPVDSKTGANTTMNVGSIEGGTTINSIAAHASALFEFRSQSAANLERMRTLFKEQVSQHRASLEKRDPAGTIELTTLGVRPDAKGVDAVELARMTERSAAIVRSVTGEEPDFSPASSDANIPLSLGICANTIGAVRGELLHTRNEWIEKDSLPEGLEVILRLMLED